MSDETESKRGEAAWKQQREEIAKRNAEAHKRGQAERRSRESAAEGRNRVQAAQEAVQLHELNARIAKRQGGDSR